MNRGVNMEGMSGMEIDCNRADRFSLHIQRQEWYIIMKNVISSFACSLFHSLSCVLLRRQQHSSIPLWIWCVGAELDLTPRSWSHSLLIAWQKKFVQKRYTRVVLKCCVMSPKREKKTLYLCYHAPFALQSYDLQNVSTVSALRLRWLDHVWNNQMIRFLQNCRS